MCLRKSVMLHHPDLDDLDEAGEDRVPAHGDQRHIGEYLRDHHGGQSRHLRSVPGDAPVSRRFVPPRTFHIIFSWEASAASTVPEHPSLNHPGTRFRWLKHRLTTENRSQPSPTFRSKSQPAARWHCRTTVEVRHQWCACVKRGPGTRIKPRGLEPLQDGAVVKPRQPPTRPEHQEPLGLEEKSWVFVQMSRSAQHVHGSRHVDLETSTTRDWSASTMDDVLITRTEAANKIRSAL